MGIIDELRGGYEFLKEIGKIEAYHEMMGKLKQVEDMLKENIALKDELRACNKELDITKRLVFQEDAFKDGVYWYEGRSFCPKCWHDKKEVVPIPKHKVVSKGETEVFYRCNVCKDTF